MIARIHAWLCRHGWHDYSIYLAEGTLARPLTIERCSRCGKQVTS